MTTVAIDVNRYLHQKKPLWNTLAIAYTLVSYVGGIALLLLPNGWLNAVGVVFLTHSLLCSAYLAHDFMHSAIFESKAWNVAFGNLMLWLNGGCYARFEDLARLHIAHHVNRVDFCRFDLVTFLQGMPAPVRSLLLALEWLYFPALAFLLRLRSIIAPFWDEERKDERWRNTFTLLIRGGLFTLLVIVSPKALLLYFFAYIGMLTVLRFVDAFQHTYEVFPVGSEIPKRDRAHEQANTFSNVVSLRYRWLNLLLLNFGYHNAHHELMKCPWYSLPDLDRDLFNGDEVHYITLPALLGNYHRYRLSRLYSGQGHGVNDQGEHSLETFYGAIEVSFLVLPA
ncbi:fatty acid desaturase [Leptolyngbya sp. FACHB-321]|uniref:fatty acid desaturase family protein n=1 Tax=Leptolyngbya sp. FACHB-321 TaxID=2692807 RepID=UPI001689316F|nr:fatty acid desaturase [Leptolyngbya sp. FACHB-321]MBD2036378.1 fatty acid desaturase [Leptolyngbya sp. FACHB-321]